MRRVVVLINVILITVSSLRVCEAADPTLSGDSFRGLRFGASLAEAATKKWELTPANDAGGENPKFQAYIRTDEQKTLGDITLLEITYYFLNGKFYGVMLQTVDGNQTEILRQALVTSRGVPLQASAPTGGLVWIGKTSSAILRRNQETGEGSVMIVGNGQQETYEAFVIEAGGKAGKDL